MSTAPQQEVLPRSSRFAIQAKLGEGGMGTVYEAVDQAHRTHVAVKTLRRLGPEEVLRFKGEFRNLQDLHHPNLVSLGELFEQEGQWFFTMELVHGCDFLRYVRPGVMALDLAAFPVDSPDASTLELPLPAGVASCESAASAEVAQGPREVARFDEVRLRAALGQLALGLNALHRAGKVHRDIKSSNILVTHQGRVVLVDFGILSEVGDTQASGSQVVVGTAGYMAPEQASGAPPSPAADWYSVGVLLYQSLTGLMPFRGSARQVLEARRVVDPVPARELVRGLPEDLGRLCGDLLNRVAEKRPSGEEVLRRLGVEQVARQEAWGTATLPFVGRAEELGALRQALEDSRSGPSVVVRVEGESGVGKSRLVRRFLEDVARDGPDTVVLAGRCYEREAVPYKGVDGVIDALARYLKGRGAARVDEVLPEGASTLALLFPVLRGVVALEKSGTSRGAGDPLTLRLAAFGALRELFARLARLHPVVLVVDDLQWADNDSLSLLDELLQAPGLLLVSTVRVNSEVSTWSEGASGRLWRQARTVALEGLPHGEALALVRQLVGEDVTAEQLRRIAQESAGLPLFIDALVRFGSSGAEGAAPEHLEGALQALVQRLEPMARQLLELLVLAQGPLSNAVASHASGFDFSEYGRQSASLRAAHLAITSGPSGADTIEVSHDRIRRALLPILEPVRRQLGHGRLAMTLETLRQGRSEMLALHWRESGQLDKALACYLRAAHEAEEALAFSREARLYRIVLELGRWSDEERRGHLVSLARALAKAGRGGEAGEVFLTAARSAPEAEASSLRQEAMQQYLLSGHMDEGLAIARQVLAPTGVRYPETTGAALGALLWQRARVRLRPLRFELRKASQLPPARLRRLDSFWGLGLGLGAVDPLRGILFQSHYLLEALSAGEPSHLCRALGLEACLVAVSSLSERPRVERCIREAEALLPLLEEDPVTRGTHFISEAWSVYFYGDMHGARERFEHGLGLLERCQGMEKELERAWIIGCWVLGMQGEVAELERRVALSAAGARERGNLLGMLMLRLGAPVLTWLARGEVDGARHEAHELISQWTGEGFHVQHFQHLYSEVSADLFQGQGQAALERLAQAWPRMKKARLLSLQAVAGHVFDLRARAGLMRAAAGGPQAHKLLRQVEADAGVLERQGLAHMKARAELLRAGVATVRGLPEQALARYRRAAEGLRAQGLGLYAASARLRLGQALGGEEGRALVEAAHAWMRGQGILSPESMADVFAPRAFRG